MCIYNTYENRFVKCTCIVENENGKYCKYKCLVLACDVMPLNVLIT